MLPVHGLRGFCPGCYIAYMNLPTKVLIVDDDPLSLDATSRILKNAGFDVVAASNGAECKRSVGEDFPDIVLLDVVLPDSD